jgi:hypothetical protein
MLHGWTLVGEMGPELVSPAGHVYTNTQSAGIISAGFYPQNSRRFGGEGPGIITPGPIIPGGGARSPRRRRSTASASVGAGDGGGGEEGETAAATAADTAAFLTPAIQAQASAAQHSANVQAAAAGQQIALMKETNMLLRQLLNNQPTARDELSNNVFLQSLNSG